jgi:uncharacterized repeat protein (TIGR03803 family)
MNPRRLCLLQIVLTLAATLGAGNSAAAATETTLHSFVPFARGLYPTSLAADASGNLYGTTETGGIYDLGVAYQLAPNPKGGWTQTVIHHFQGGSDGELPVSVLAVDAKGNLYGSTRGGGGSTNCYSGCGAIFQLTRNSQGAWNYNIVYRWQTLNDGYLGGVFLDAAGNLYGTTFSWSGPVYGSLFQLIPSPVGPWTEKRLHRFSGGTDGGAPSNVVADKNGNLYGAASLGGSAKAGLVFEFTPSSNGNWTEHVLYNFTNTGDGVGPNEVILDPAGNLYGTTAGGGTGCSGSGGCAVVFQLKPGSNYHWTESVIYNFTFSPSYPSAQFLDTSGNLYGSTYYGGGCDSYCGTVFQLTPNSSGQWTQTVLWNFTGGYGGQNPYTILPGATGQIYGITGLGGASGLNGTVFQLSPGSAHQWELTTLFSFPFTDGGYPSNLIADSAGDLYGSTNIGGTYGLGTVFEFKPTGGDKWQENQLYNFSLGLANNVNGVGPSGLTFDAAGNLYGTTIAEDNTYAGTVFELSPSAPGNWTEKDLVRFSYSGGPDFPIGGVVFNENGRLYGVASLGAGHALGAVFELTPGSNGEWTERVIHAFSGYPSDGAYPQAGLIADESGNIYGTTQNGGSSANCKRPPIGCGTIFELSYVSGVGWKESMLYSFKGATSDGASPSASLILDSSGNLYGTTSRGGIKNKSCTPYGGPAGCGVIFELSPSAGGLWNESVLYQFTNSAGDGSDPLAGLIFDQAGNLYGTTDAGGVNGFGTVFKLAPGGAGSWTESVLYGFQSGYDGQYPTSSLIFGSNGHLYGTTARGGTANSGTVFEITP